MQLLEQLASGIYGYTETDFATEAASIMGYLECMDDLLEQDILTEGVVTEGIDLKAIGRKAIQIIRGLLKRVGDMFRSLGKFIRTKAQQIKQKLSKGKKGSGSSSGDSKPEPEEKQPKEESPKDEKGSDDSKKESKTSDQGDAKTTSQQSSTSKDTGTHKPDNTSTSKSSTAALPQKSNEELLDDVVKGTTYPAPFPGFTNNAFVGISDVFYAVNHNYRFLAGRPINTMYKCFVEGKSPKNKDFLDDEDTLMTDEEIVEYLFDAEEYFKGSLKSPADAKKIPNVIYDNCIKQGDNKIDSYGRYDHYFGRFQFAQSNYMTYSENISKAIDGILDTIKISEDKLDMVEKKLGEAGDIDPNMSKMIATAQRMSKTTTEYVCSVAMGISDFYNRVSKDLDAGSAYFAKMDAKIKAAGLWDEVEKKRENSPTLP